MNKHISPILVLGCLFLVSCSTMINTPTQEINLKSNPPNAKITIDGKKYGTTPQLVNIERGSNHVVKLDLTGYEPYELQVTTKLSPWVWTNIFNGFLPGFAVDYITGSLNELYPDTLTVPLTPAPVKPEPTKK